MSNTRKRKAIRDSSDSVRDAAGTDKNVILGKEMLVDTRTRKEAEDKYVVQLSEAYGLYTHNDIVVVTGSQRSKMLKAGVIRP